MLYAYVGEEKVEAEKGKVATCPFCKQNVKPRVGDINVPHWAHESGHPSCDTWADKETEWHLNHKKGFEKKNVEVMITKDGKTHIADFKNDDGVVIEFQHSPMSPSERFERESFYGNMIWLIDCTGKNISISPQSDSIVMNKEFFDREPIPISFIWRHPKKWITEFDITCPIYLDLGQNVVLRISQFYPKGIGFLISRPEFYRIYMPKKGIQNEESHGYLFKFLSYDFDFCKKCYELSKSLDLDFLKRVGVK
jgi:hypothetical protein